jgi:hypothetical protein
MKTKAINSPLFTTGGLRCCKQRNRVIMIGEKVDGNGTEEKVRGSTVVTKFNFAM